MKLQLVLLPLLLVCISLSGLKAQTGSDSVAYSAGFYTVKPGEQDVIDVAKSQKVDPKIVVAMNGFANSAQILNAGQKIKIPIYQHGYKYVLTESDITPLKAGNKRDRNRKNKYQADVAYAFELQKNRLMLIDATLELDETLLQGIKASLDSLKNADKNVIDEKNISLTLRRMQRARDKIVLTPFLFHFRDSMANDISRLVVEKSAIQSRMTNSQLQQAKNKPENDKALADVDEDAGKSHMGNDLSPEGNLPVEPRRGGPVVTREVIPVKHADTAARVATDAPASAKVRWTSAKALDPNSDHAMDSLFQQANPDLTAIEMAPPGQVSSDTLAYKPVAKTQTDEEKDVMMDSINRLKAAVFLTRAQKALNEKNSASAETLLQKSIDESPDYYDAWFALADLHVSKDLITKALKEYEICRKLNSREPRLYYKMANAYFRAGKKNEALDYYNQSLKLDSLYFPSILGSASIMIQRGQYAAAIAKCSKVLESNRTYHAAYKLRGIAEYMNKDYNPAIDDFTRYLLFDETDPFVYYYRGITKIVSKDKEAGCFDLSTSAQLGYEPALQTMQHSCQDVK